MPERPDNIVPLTQDAVVAAERFGASHDRELLTILFTDLVDSTKLQSEQGNEEAARLTELHRAIVRRELEPYDAREIEWAGDSCLAVFSKPSDAVAFALRIQSEHNRSRKSEPKLPMVRIGLHLGEIVVKKREDGGKKTEDLFGLQVSETARVMSVARGNQIFCTLPVADNARAALKGAHLDDLADVQWRDHGYYDLKGSEKPIEIFEVGEQDLAPFTPPETNDKCRKVAGGPAQLRTVFLTLAIGGGTSVALLLTALAFLDINAPSSDLPDLQPAEFNLVPAPQPVKRYSMSLPFDQAVAGAGITSYTVAFSPDGDRLAYVAQAGTTKMLALRRTDRLGAEILSGTEGARNPFFSPDGQWVGFYTQPGGDLKKVSVRGGEPVTLCKARLPFGAFWGDDGFITFAARVGAGLMRVPDAGGDPVSFTTLDPETREIVHMFPAPLPNPDAIIITTGTAPDITRAQVEVLSLETGERTLIAEKAVRGRYLPTGHIVYVQQGAFMAVPFSTDTLQVTGPPFNVTEERMTANDWPPRQFAISTEGDLAFVPQDATSPDPRTIVWVDRQGQQEPVLVPPRRYHFARVSPDNTRVALKYVGSHDIWIFDMKKGTNRRFTFDPAADGNPEWSPDGRTLAFSSARDLQFNIYTKSLDGAAEPTRIFKSPQIYHPRQWIEDGRYILYYTQNPDTGSDLGMIAVDGSGRPTPLVESPDAEWSPALSSDGRWLAYISDESGRFEVFARGLRNPEHRVQVSVNGGTQPQWNPKKNELFYRDGSHFLAVDIEFNETLTASVPRALFEDDHYAPDSDRPLYNVSRDGQRFLFIREPEEDDPRAHADGTELIIVENWFQELRNKSAGE